MALPNDPQIVITLKANNQATSEINALQKGMERLATTGQRSFMSATFGPGAGQLPDSLLSRPGTRVGGIKSRFDPRRGSFLMESMLSQQIETLDSSGAVVSVGRVDQAIKKVIGNGPGMEVISKALVTHVELLSRLTQEYMRLTGSIQAAQQAEKNRRIAERDSLQAQFKQAALARGGYTMDASGRYRRGGAFAATADVDAYLAQELASRRGGAVRRATASAAVATDRISTQGIREQRRELRGLGTDIRKIYTGVTELEQAYYSAAAAPPPIPPSVARLAQMSPSAYTMLRRQGLGGELGSTPTDPKILASMMQMQDAAVNYTHDVTKGLTRATASWKDHNNMVRRASFEIDNNGKVITRWGGNLSGLNNVLSQTGRNVFKVVEWTIATTAVLGAVRAMESAIDTVKTLDRSMRSFGITAEMSTQETRQFFGELSDVAIKTATPILDLIKAADDMALATSRAGQSTKEWQQNILNLSNAVGILTNLSGMDTVQATDLLTSTMKQLGLETSDLVGILNKITAVAGGQQGAITDIARGLGVMAEAANQAGLDINESIATIQVLSQVTSKSAAEVATAFKNLVGSIDSRASIKALDEFGIAVRDTATGSLRPFLDIYADIQRAIEGGIIPEGRVKEVIKAISGGPRRAPDASALLANVSQIFEVEERAVNATNEALIANAKILDTIDAKTIKLQNSLKALFFEKFGESIKDNYSGVLEVLTAIIGLIDKIPNGVIAGATAFGLIAGVATAVKAVMIRLEASVFNYTSGLVAANEVSKIQLSLEKQTLDTIEAANIALREQQSIRAGLESLGQTPTQADIDLVAGNTRRAKIKSAALSSLAAGGIMLGLGAAQNGTEGIKDSLDDALMGAGFNALIMLPGQLKLVGAGLLALGGVINVVSSNTAKFNANVQELQEELYSQITSLDSIALANKAVEEEQGKLLDQITRLSSKTNLTAEEQSRLNELTAQYGAATGQAVLGAQNYNETLQQILDTAQQLENTDISAGLVSAIRNGLGNEEERINARKELTRVLLSRNDPTLAAMFQSMDNPLMPNSSFAGNLYGGTLAMGERRVVTGSSGQGNYKSVPVSFDLRNLANDPSQLLRLIDKETGQLNYSIPLHKKNIDLLTAAYEALDKQAPGTLGKIGEGIAKFASGSITTEADFVIKSQQAYIRAKELLGEITPEESRNRQQTVESYYAIKSRVGGNRVERAMQMSSLDNLFIKDGEFKAGLTQAEFAKIIEMVPALSAEFDKLKGQAPDLTSAYTEFGRQFGIVFTDAAGGAREAAAASAELEEALRGVDGVIADLVDKGAAAAFETFKDFLSGNITREQYNEINTARQGLIDIQIEAERARGALFETFKVSSLEQLSSSFENDILGPLKEIPMLSNAGQLGVSGLISLFGDLATSGELTTDGMINMTAILTLFKNLLDSINNRTITIPINFAVNRSLSSNPAERISGAPGETRPSGAYGNLTPRTLEDIIKSNSGDIIKQLEDFFANRGNFSSGNRGGGGGGGSSANTLDRIQMLDLAKELVPYSPGIVDTIIAKAKVLQTQLGLNDENKNSQYAIMNGTQIIAKGVGIGNEVLRQVMEELTDVERKRLEQESKADSIRRIRIGSGEFAGFANVPLNSITGVSAAKDGPINIRLDINGQILTPAQLRQIADMVLAGINLRN